MHSDETTAVFNIMMIIKFRKLRCSELLFRNGKPNNSYTIFVDELPFRRPIKYV
jgi:hypothetical protein